MAAPRRLRELDERFLEEEHGECWDSCLPWQIALTVTLLVVPPLYLTASRGTVRGPTRHHHHRAPASSGPAAFDAAEHRRYSADERRFSATGSGASEPSLAAVVSRIEPRDALADLLQEKLRVSRARMRRAPPAYERFPQISLRYRLYGKGGKQTRHARGDLYPLYTMDTMRNLADHIFDWMTGYGNESAARARAAAIRPCDLVYSTLRPTSTFVERVHRHVGGRYLLLTDTAAKSVRHGCAEDRLRLSPRVAAWFANDNEMRDEGSTRKMVSLPVGVDDALEVGVAGEPGSVAFHANVTDFLATLAAAQAQRKDRWLAPLQMKNTHAERTHLRRVVARRFRLLDAAELDALEGTDAAADDGGGAALAAAVQANDTAALDAEIPIAPPSARRLNLREFLLELGRHRFVLSPRGAGLDCHRTWEALLVGAIPIVRTSALDVLYERLPVLVLSSWSELRPRLLRRFYAYVQARRGLFDYERLFADHWIGRIELARERCLALERARFAPRYAYNYSARGGWEPVPGSRSARGGRLGADREPPSCLYASAKARAGGGARSGGRADGSPRVVHWRRDPFGKGSRDWPTIRAPRGPRIPAPGASRKSPFLRPARARPPAPALDNAHRAHSRPPASGARRSGAAPRPGPRPSQPLAKPNAAGALRSTAPHRAEAGPH